MLSSFITVYGQPITEHTLDICEGYAAFGVRVQTEEMSTIADFIEVDGIWIVLYHNEERRQVFSMYKHHSIQNGEYDIQGEASYLVHAGKDMSLKLKGHAWADLVPSAPPVIMRPRTLTTTWG